MSRALIELIWVNDLSIQKLLNVDRWISNYFLWWYSKEIIDLVQSVFSIITWKCHILPTDRLFEKYFDVQRPPILTLMLTLKFASMFVLTWIRSWCWCWYWNLIFNFWPGITLWWRTTYWTSLCRRKTSSRIFSLEYLNSSISSRQHPHFLLPSQRDLDPPFHHSLSTW